MALTLPSELEALVDRKVAEDGYDSRLAVIREALQLLELRDGERRRKREALQEDIALGLEQLDRGEGRPFDAAAVERIIARGEQQLAGAETQHGPG